MRHRNPPTVLLAALVGVVGFVVVGAVTYAVTSGPSVVQYPPGQRPCTAALTALDAVTLMQLREGAGPADPDGDVRDALEHAHEVLTTYRAGESGAYSAATYHALADAAADRIPPLIDAYDAEDPDTPWTDSAGYYATSATYSNAAAELRYECTRTE